MKCLGVNVILNYYYETVTYVKDKKGWRIPFSADQWKNIKLNKDLVDAKTGKVLAEIGTKLTPRAVKKLQEEGIEEILVPQDDLISRFLAVDYIDSNTGEILGEAGMEISEKLLTTLDKIGITSIKTLNIDYVYYGPYLRNTIISDKNTTREEALLDIYRVLRPGDPPTFDSAEALFNGLFFDPERFDLSSVGRVKLNSRLGFEDVSDTMRVLRREDILEIIRVLLDLKDGKGQVDDIDNLANRRVRAVGELLENQYRLGLLRMERAIRERISSVDVDSVMPP